jgi:hypothetical protein
VPRSLGQDYAALSRVSGAGSKEPLNCLLFRTNFAFTNEAADHFAKALKHAVILCGGKPPTF